MTQHKFGKLAPQRRFGVPAFGDFLSTASAWPPVAAQGWEGAVSSFDCLGNDQWGDCAEAGAMHLIQVQTANTGRPLHGTLAQTEALYSTLTGFNPNISATDNGTELIALLDYWKNTGIEVTDATGNVVVHKIAAFATLDTTSIAQMRYANFLFGGTYLGLQCPQSAEQDTSNWTYHPGSPTVGGHCVSGTGQGSDGGHLVSWGKLIPFTWEFALKYLDEGYIVVSELWLDKVGESPSGLDLDGLLKAAQTI